MHSLKVIGVFAVLSACLVFASITSSEERNISSERTPAVAPTVLQVSTFRTAALQQTNPDGETGPASNTAFPNTDDGKPITQLGLDGWDSNSAMVPFLNLAMLWGSHEDGPFVAEGPGKEPMNFRALWNGGFIDKETLLPKAMPPGYKSMRTGAFRQNARFYPDYFAGDYVLEWDGDADMRFRMGESSQKFGSKRVVGHFPSSWREGMSTEITRLGPGGLKGVRLYRKEYENRVGGGEFWDPDYLEHVSRYKIIRTLDIQSPNTSTARDVTQLTQKSQAIWGLSAAVDPATPDAPQGKPIEALFDLAVATDTALWMHVSGLIGAGPQFDQFNLRTQGDKEGLKVLAAEKGREIIASDAWDGYATEVVRSLIVSGYPETRMLYIEVGNELWNNAHPFWWLGNYYAHIGVAFGVTEARGLAQNFGGGVATARFTVAFDKALKEVGRKQAWTPILAGQNDWSEPLRSSINGFKAYLGEMGVDSAPYLKRAGATTASYYFGAIDPWGVIKGGNGTPSAYNSMTPAQYDAWKSDWKHAILERPDALAQQMEEWLVEGNGYGSISHVIDARKANRVVAEAAGVKFIGDYEGESHLAGGIASGNQPWTRSCLRQLV